MGETPGGKHKKPFFVKHFLPLGFATAVIWALVWPQPGAFLAEINVDDWQIVKIVNMGIIFLIFGLTLQTDEMIEALKAWKAVVLGLVSILFLTSLTGFITMEIPFKPPEFGIGLSIFAVVPTALSAGVSLVISGYGNGALALLLTVGSNIIGIFTSPAFVKAVLGSATNADIDSVGLLIRLSVAILVPLVIGKAIRDIFKGLQPLIYKYKTPLYLLNNFQVIMIVWQTLSHSQEVLIKQCGGSIIVCIMAAIIQHFCFLVMNVVFTWALRIPEKERKAIIIMASQKALPIAATIAGYLDPEQVGDTGLITVPCIVFYVGQLFVDSYICNNWAGKYEKVQGYEATLKEAMQEAAEEESKLLSSIPSATAPAELGDGDFDDIGLLGNAH